MFPRRLTVCIGVGVALSYPLTLLKAADSPSPSAPNCGLTSIRALAELAGTSVSPVAWEATVRKHGKPALDMAEVAQVGKELGLGLAGWRMELGELIARNAPAVVHFNDEHYSVFLDSTHGVVRWLDLGTRLRVTPAADFARRFSGHCLVPESVSNQVLERPALTLPDLHFDAGSVLVDTIEHVFGCVNAGSQPLLLTVLPVLGDCEIAVEPQGTVPPRGKARIRVRAPANRVEGLLGLKVISNDHVRPVQYLTVVYRKPAPISVTPERLSMVGERGFQGRRRVYITGIVPAAITDVSAMNPALSVEVVHSAPTTDELAETAQLEARVVTCTPGMWRGDILVKTIDPRAPVVVVPTSVEVRGHVQVKPDQAFFGVVREGDSAERMLVISAPKAPGFEVTSARADLEGIRLGAVRRRDDGCFALVATLASELRAGTFLDGGISVRTNVPGEERIEIHVTAYVVRVAEAS